MISQARLGRAASTAAVAFVLAGCDAICLVAPCDTWTPIEVANMCGYDIEASSEFVGDGPPEYAGVVLAAGESTDLDLGGAEIDVWIRVPGAVPWPVVVHWAEIEATGVDESGVYAIDASGDRCPK